MKLSRYYIAFYNILEASSIISSFYSHYSYNILEASSIVSSFYSHYSYNILEASSIVSSFYSHYSYEFATQREVRGPKRSSLGRAVSGGQSCVRETLFRRPYGKLQQIGLRWSESRAVIDC